MSINVNRLKEQLASLLTDSEINRLGLEQDDLMELLNNSKECNIEFKADKIKVTMVLPNDDEVTLTYF